MEAVYLCPRPISNGMKNLKVIVVLPAYNAAETLEKTIADVPMSFVSELILVDDASNDETIEVAKRLKLKLSKPLTIYRHDRNKGYGGNQKTCYKMALEHGADIVVMLHPDYQYDSKLIKYFVDFIKDGYFDVMLGSRVRSRHETLGGGMPFYKYVANRLLTLWYNIVTGYNLSEWHTGMRAYSREVLEAIDFHKFSDDFIFDTQTLFAITKHSYRIGDIPVPCRYFKEASSINLYRSINYGFAGLWESLKYIAGAIRF